MIEMYCCVPVSPMRLEASHRSEMVSQLLFGEFCAVLNDGDLDFSKIRCSYDGYEGWVQKSHLLPLNDKKNISLNGKLTAAWVNEIEFNGSAMMVPKGSKVLDENSLRDGEIWNTNVKVISSQLVKQVAFTFLNTPYLWGGKSVFGIDCSGFAQMVYKFLGILLPRDSSVQAQAGEQVSFLQEVKCGDLAFFDNEEGRINHVGILLNEHEIIHASGKVRVDKIDQHGILNTDTNLRTHHLRIIKRYF